MWWTCACVGNLIQVSIKEKYEIRHYQVANMNKSSLASLNKSSCFRLAI